MSLDITTPQADAEEREIDPIRVELLSTEMPIHQLAKRGDEPIRILKRGTDGRVKLQWRVDYSSAVGHPGQLAYHLDTWVIKRRLSKLRRPYPRLVRIGDLREIARELKHGGDTNSVRRAFEQNAATFIRARVTYRRDGGEEVLEGYFNRYNVFFRGHPLPGGRRAETVYISLNDPYYALLNRPENRPLDFSYLRQLTPAAQRFYELLSPKVFAALKNGYPNAWVRYSEYCELAVQRRQTTRSRMQAQMAKVHGPHRESGYISGIRYRSAQSADGAPDWTIEYEPGVRAVTEHRFFNERSGRTRRATPPRTAAKVARGTTVGQPASTDPDPAILLAKRFAERRHGSSTSARPELRQVERARDLLRGADGNFEVASAAIGLAAFEGRMSRSGFPADMGGVLSGGYVARAIGRRDHARSREESNRQKQEEAERREAYREWCERRASKRIADLTDSQRDRLLADRDAACRAKHNYLPKTWTEEAVADWVADRILRDYGQEGRPSFEEWAEKGNAVPPT